MSKTETLNLRVSGEFKRRLIKEARKKRRSITNYIEAVISDLWEQEASRAPRRKTGERHSGKQAL